MSYISDKIKSLKVGDAVVEYQRLDNRRPPVESKVQKIGRTYIHVGTTFTTKYDFNGNADYGYNLFPGSLKEFKKWQESQTMAKNILHKLEYEIYDFLPEDLDIINTILLKYGQD